MANEVWRPIVGYEDQYKVSSFGRVMNIKRNRLLTPSMSTNGYVKYGLYRNGIFKNIDLHRILAITFIPGHRRGLVVNHKDGNKLNNNLDNLEWVTVERNNNHAKEIGLLNPPTGEKHGNSKLMVNLETGIFYESLTEAASSTNYSKCYVSAMIRGRNKNKISLAFA